MNRTIAKKLKTLLFYVALLASVTSTKLELQGSCGAPLSDFIEDNENPCYLGNASQLITVLTTAVETFEQQAFVEKDEFVIIFSLAKKISDIQVNKYKEETNLVDQANSILGEFKKTLDDRSEIALIKNLPSKIGEQEASFNEFVQDVFKTLKDLVCKLVDESCCRPFYFKFDFFRAINYYNVSRQLSRIINKNACISPSFLLNYDELLTDLNGENLIIEPLKSNTFTITKEAINKGKISLVFWMNLSIKSINKGNTQVMTLTTGEQTTSLIIKKGEDCASVDQILTVGDKTFVIPNKASCNDIQQVIFEIEKHYNAYKFNLIIKSNLTNKRSEISILVPKCYVEFGTFNFPSQCIVKQENIHVAYAALGTAKWELEFELTTQITTKQVAEIRDLVVEQCEKRPPACLYLDSGDCMRCIKGLLNIDGQCKAECPEGFFYCDLSLQCQACKENCKTCDNAKTCITCKEGFLLLNGQCVAGCPAAHYLEQGVCKPCKEDCIVCSSANDCEKCKTKFLWNSECNETCPVGTYSELNPNICKICCNHCAECTKRKVCDKCEIGYYLSGEKCLETCPQGTFACPLTGKCQKCSDFCESCEKKSECKRCSTGYTLLQGQCSTECPKGTISLGGVCVPCENGCDSCMASDKTICIKCSPGKFLKNGKCVDDCKKYFMFANENGECEACTKNCKDCNNATKCEKCFDNFFLFKCQCVQTCPDGFVGIGLKCEPCSPESNCKTCCKENTAVCKTCFDGNYIFNGKCVESCPTGTYLHGKECVRCSSDCLSCTSGANCELCIPTKFLKDGKCLDNCGDGYTADENVCKPCQVSDCSDCSKNSTICEKCKDPLVLFNGTCLAQCPQGSYKDSNRVCKPCMDNCDVCNCSAKCQKCSISFFLLTDKTCADKCPCKHAEIDNECIECLNPRCKICSDDLKTCTVCSADKVLYKGDCIEECPTGTFLNEERKCEECRTPCKECTEKACKCTSCIDNYSLTKDNKCTGTCDNGFVKVEGKCEKCDQDCCLICQADLTTCIKCNEGKVLLNGRCHFECPHEYFAKDGVCYPCSNDCKTCECAAKCTICNEGFSLLNKLCVEKCPCGHVAVDTEMGSICEKCGENCKSCSPLKVTECYSCQTGFFLLDSKCVPICPAGYFADAENKKCIKCSTEFCDKCDEKDHCLSCLENKRIFNNTCVDICPAGYRNNEKICEKCSVENCKRCCVNKDACTKCNENFFKLDDSNCVEKCPCGTYPDPVHQVCHPCNDKCKKCTDDTTCQECKVDFFLSGSICQSICPTGTVEDRNTGRCEECGPNCSKCNESNHLSCTKCDNGFFLDDDKCVEVCRDGYYADKEKGSCESCRSNCLKCKDAVICDECKPNFSIIKGKCCDLCPEFYTKFENKCLKCETATNCLKCCSKDVKKCIDCGSLILFNNKCYEKCPDGYRFNNNTCEKCLPNCNKCSSSDTCDECNLPFLIGIKGNCVEKCCEGRVAIDFKCESCNDLNCSVCGTDKECQICKDNYFIKKAEGQIKCVTDCGEGFYLDENECKKCNDLNCSKCTNSNDCQACNNQLFLLNNSECVTKCPEGKAPVDGICVDCEQGCLQCCQANQQTCLKCSPEKVLFEGDCIDKCPEKYVKLVANPGVCTPCSNSHCLICCDNNQNKCKICEKGWFVGPDGACTEKCPVGYTSVDGKCQPCEVSQCKICDSDISKCEVCNEPLFLSFCSKKCLPECPKCQYVKSGKCEKCGENCAKCEDNSGNCLECKTGFFINDLKQCSSDCKINQIKINNICVNCSVEYCLTCAPEDINTCSVCIEGKYLFEGKCVDVCPERTFASKLNVCEPCGPNCKQCKCEKKCNICDENYVLQGGKCQTECDAGFVNINGVCTECGDSTRCQECCPKNVDKCKVCRDGFLLKDGICVDKCGCQYFIHQLHNECVPCLEHCKVCKDSLTCDKCLSPYLLQNNKCVEKCCPESVSFNGECKKCSNSLCLECLPQDLDTCLKCKEGYFLKDNQCAESCGVGFYSTEDRICKPCADSNCLKCCEKGSKCKDCKDGWYLYDFKCAKECPSGYVADSADVCLKCNQDECKICEANNLGVCIECQVGFLKDGICVDDCPVGFYGKDKKCLPCSLKCLECTSDTVCLKCETDFALSEGKCIGTCPERSVLIDGKCVPCKCENCLVCQKDLITCEKCATPFLLLDGKCKKECPVQYYSNGTSCEKCENNCDTCTSSTDCTKCSFDYYLLTGDCYKPCPEFTYADKSDNTCKNCSDTERCLQCPTGPNICELCKSGVLVEGKCADKCPDGTFFCDLSNKCQICKDNCLLCSSKSSCSKCKEGFILNENECISACPPRTVLSDNKCVPCGNGCETCCPQDQKKCLSCSTPLKLYQKTCVEECPAGTFATIENEKEICKPCGTHCLTCVSEQECKICQESFVIFEGLCVDNCPNGYANVKGICLPCADQVKCNKCCPNNLNKCTECKENFFKHNGICLDACEKGYFSNIETKSCDKCDETCSECKNADECTVCKDKLYFKEGTYHCQSCISPFVVVENECRTCKSQNCDKCIDGNDRECQICSGTYVLITGQCYSECPERTFKVGQECKPCGPSCIKCTNENQCIICDDFKVLFEGKCVEKCLVGFGVNNRKECIQCKVLSCEECDGNRPEVCTKCPSNFKLSENKCLEECPAGYFESGTTCLKCPDFCLSCDDATSCRKCIDEYFIKDNVCTNCCGWGFFADKIAGKCVPCGTEHCKKCTAEGCNLCEEGFFLHQGQCVIDCPESFYKKDGHCKPCGSGCSKCICDKECISCIEGLVLFEKKCVSTCPTGYTKVNGNCIPCNDPICEICAVNSPGVCEKCSSGYLLGSNCVSKCPKNFFLCDVTKKCQPCNSKCVLCETESTNCSECKDEFILQGNTCISSCPVGTVKHEDKCLPCGILNCDVCILLNGQAKCIDCAEGFLLQLDGTCADSCPPTTYADNGKCLPCVNGCKECTSEDFCISCKQYLFLYEGKCLAGCVEGTYPDCGDPLRCTKCDSACTACTGATNKKCYACAAGYILKDTTCIQEITCGDGFYKDAQLNECKACDLEHCISCSSATNCTQCKRLYDLKDGTCQTTGAIEIVHQGSLLQTPLSINYNEVHAVELKSYPSLSKPANNLSIVAWIRDLGTRQTLSQKDESIIFSYSINGWVIHLLIRKSDEKGVIRIISQAGVGTDLDTQIDFSTKVLFKWKLLILTAFQATNSYDFLVILHGLESKPLTFEFPADFDIVNDSAKLIFLTDDSSSSSGTQLSNISIANYKISRDTIDKFVINPPLSPSWLCEKADETCKPGFIALEQQFSEFNKEYNLLDFANLNKFDSIYWNFGAEFLFYADSIENENEFTIVDIVYPYIDKAVKISYALSLKVNGSRTVPVANKNVIEIPSKLIVAKTWYTILISLTSDDTNVTYKIQILESNLKKTVVDTKVLVETDVRLTVKLFIDALIRFGCSSIKGQVYNPIIILGDDDIQSKPIEELAGTDTCVKFGLNFKCEQCEEYHVKDEAGLCVDNAVNLGKKIFDMKFAYNQSEDEVDIPEEFLNKDFSIIFTFRKLVHTINIEEIKLSHNLLRLKSPTNTYSLMIEKADNKYKSEISVGDQTIFTDFSNVEFPFMNVILNYVYKKQEVTIVAGYLQEVYTHTIKINEQFTKLVFFDKQEFEIQFEVLNGIVYPKALKKNDLENLVKRKLIPADPVCVESDLTTGKCIKCMNKNISEVKCASALLGMSYFQFFGEELITNVNSSYELKAQLSNSVNSSFYAITTRVKLYQLQDIDFKGTGNYNILTLMNDAHIGYKPINPSIIMYASIEVRNGNPKLVLYVNNSVQLERFEVPALKVEYNTWIFIAMAVDVSAKSFIYTISTTNFRDSQIVSLKYIPEKLQNAGKLVILDDKVISQNGNLSCYLECVHSYVIPNPPVELAKLINLLETNPKYIPNEPLQIKDCKFSTIDPITQSSICLICNTGFVTKAGQCAKIPTRINGYSLLNTLGGINREKVTYNLKYPFNTHELILIAFFRVNIFTEEPIVLLTTGEFTLKLNLEATATYIEFANEKIGPFDPIRFKSTNYAYIVIGNDHTKVCIRNCDSPDFSDEDCTTTAFTYDLPKTLEVDNSKYTHQVFGEQVVQFDYLVPAFDMCGTNSCGSDCNACKLGVCYSSHSEILPDGSLVPRFVSIDSSHFKIEDIAQISQDPIRSDNYSFKFNVILSKLSPDDELFNLSLGFESFIKVKFVSKSKFILQFKNYFVSKDSIDGSLISTELPEAPKNGKLAFILSVNNNMRITLFIFDSNQNFVFKAAVSNGFMNYLTDASRLTLNEAIEKSQVSLSSTLHIIDYKSEAQKMILFAQSSCKSNSDENQYCTDCAKGYTINTATPTSTLLKACVKDTKYFNSQSNVVEELNLITATKEFVYASSVSRPSSYESLSFVTNLSLPTISSVEMSLLRIMNGVDILIEVKSVNNGLTVSNNITGKSIIIEDLLKDEGNLYLISLAINWEFLTGTTDVFAYSTATQKSANGQSKGKAQQINDLGDIKVSFGIVDSALLLPEVYIRFQGADLYFNTFIDKIGLEALSYQDINELSFYKQNQDVFYPEGKILASTDSMIQTLGFLVPPSKNAKYYNINISLTANFAEDSTIFALTNTYTLDDLQLIQKDILPESVSTNNILSIISKGSKLILNVKGKQKITSYELIPALKDNVEISALTRFSKVLIQIQVNTIDKSLKIKTTSDNLTKRQVLRETEPFQYQQINGHTGVYIGKGAARVDFDFTKRLFDNSLINLDKTPAENFCSSLTPDCLICEVGEKALCKSCVSQSSLNGKAECIPSEFIVSKLLLS